jgi:hypothetical protein
MKKTMKVDGRDYVVEYLSKRRISIQRKMIVRGKEVSSLSTETLIDPGFSALQTVQALTWLFDEYELDLAKDGVAA